MKTKTKITSLDHICLRQNHLDKSWYKIWSVSDAKLAASTFEKEVAQNKGHYNLKLVEVKATEKIIESYEC